MHDLCCYTIYVLTIGSVASSSSQRHARSEKLLKEGRLKRMLNEVGELEGDSSPERQVASSDSEEV